MIKIKKNILILLIIFLFANNVYAIDGYIQFQNYNKQVNEVPNGIDVSNEKQEFWIWTINLEEEILKDFYLGTTLDTYNKPSFSDKEPIGFMPKRLNYNIYLKYNYDNWQFKFESICKHPFKQDEYMNYNYEELKYSVRYNF